MRKGAMATTHFLVFVCFFFPQLRRLAGGTLLEQAAGACTPMGRFLVDRVAAFAVLCSHRYIYYSILYRAQSKDWIRALRGRLA